MMFHERLVHWLGRVDTQKQGEIISKLPYKSSWLRKALKNAEIKKFITGSNQRYTRTQRHHLRLHRTVRCHMHLYGNVQLEETMYCEFTDMLSVMAQEMHDRYELHTTSIALKFGY